MVGGESPGAGCDLWPLMSRSSLPLAFVRGLEPCSVRCSSFVDHLSDIIDFLSSVPTIPSTRQPMRHLNACLTLTRPTALSRGSTEPHSCITDEESIMLWLVIDEVAIHLVDENTMRSKVCW
jgi:hypothetical protein